MEHPVFYVKNAIATSQHSKQNLLNILGRSVLKLRQTFYLFRLDEEPF